MSNLPSRPMQPTRDERRRMLAHHFLRALEPVLEDGTPYAELSVARMIRAVGVSRATFYSYFDDKTDLLRAMGEGVTEELAAAGAHWFGLGLPGSREDVRDALRPLVTVYREHRLILGAITEAAAYDAGMRALYEELVARAAAGLQEHLAALPLERDGERLDPEAAAAWLVWMLERGLAQLVAAAPEGQVDRHLGTVVEMLWRMLYEK